HSATGPTARAHIVVVSLSWAVKQAINLQQPLRREWFFEQRDGNCRLMACFTAQLSETTTMWARAVGPVAEWVARQLWLTTRKRTQSDMPPTHLTQTHRREAKGVVSIHPDLAGPRLQNLCRGCGKTI